jgi:hypothetical protein
MDPLQAGRRVQEWVAAAQAALVAMESAAAGAVIAQDAQEVRMQGEEGGGSAGNTRGRVEAAAFEAVRRLGEAQAALAELADLLPG